MALSFIKDKTSLGLDFARVSYLVFMSLIKNLLIHKQIGLANSR